MKSQQNIRNYIEFDLEGVLVDFKVDPLLNVLDANQSPNTTRIQDNRDKYRIFSREGARGRGPIELARVALVGASKEELQVEGGERLDHLAIRVLVQIRHQCRRL